MCTRTKIHQTLYLIDNRLIDQMIFFAMRSIPTLNYPVTWGIRNIRQSEIHQAPYVILYFIVNFFPSEVSQSGEYCISLLFLAYISPIAKFVSVTLSSCSLLCRTFWQKFTLSTTEPTHQYELISLRPSIIW